MKIQNIFSTVYESVEQELESAFSKECLTFSTKKNAAVLHRDSVMKCLQDLLFTANERVGRINDALRHNSDELKKARVREFQEARKKYSNKKERLIAPAEITAQNASKHRLRMEEILRIHQGGTQERCGSHEE